MDQVGFLLGSGRCESDSCLRAIQPVLDFHLQLDLFRQQIKDIAEVEAASLEGVG